MFRMGQVAACVSGFCLTSFVLSIALSTVMLEALAENREDASSETENLIGHGGPVHAVRLNKHKTRALTGSLDNSMMVWDLARNPPRVLRRFDDHDGWVKAVQFLPNERLALAAEGGGKIWLWDLVSGEVAHIFEGHQAEVSALAVSADGQWAASASTDRTARLWNIASRAPGPVLSGHKGPVNAIAFSDNGRQVFTASYDGTIRVWDRQSGRIERVLYRHGFGVNVLAPIPDAGQLAFGALDGASGIIDLASGELVSNFAKQGGPVLAIALIKKPGLLAVSGSQKNGRNVVGLIRVWRIGDWALIEEYEDPRGPIWAMDFAAEGTAIYYGGKDDFVTRWQVRPRKAFEPLVGPIPRRFEVSNTASQGELQFARKCSLCHTLKPDGRNRAGPTLYGLFGRRAGALKDYPYSKALLTSKVVWSEETVAKLFTLGPEHYLPGTKMPLQRIKDAGNIEALVTFLKTATKKSDSGRSSAGED